ncbi:unnamed protein product [Prorocentrum cordatum]|uniref:RNA helicase n=1 Tax=Prorocentrum cordatum TaxID=2364126 RepID=A0ABN9XPI3_9DINO|nr:unnamed protein product [Polarella glacialis]
MMVRPASRRPRWASSTAAAAGPSAAADESDVDSSLSQTHEYSQLISQWSDDNRSLVKPGCLEACEAAKAQCKEKACDGVELQEPPFKQCSPPGAERPRMLYAKGCSGSTWVQKVARELMKLHGFCVSPVAYEPLNPTSDVKRLFSYDNATIGDRARDADAWDCTVELVRRRGRARRAFVDLTLAARVLAVLPRLPSSRRTPFPPTAPSEQADAGRAPHVTSLARAPSWWRRGPRGAALRQAFHEGVLPTPFGLRGLTCGRARRSFTILVSCSCGRATSFALARAAAAPPLPAPGTCLVGECGEAARKGRRRPAPASQALAVASGSVARQPGQEPRTSQQLPPNQRRFFAALWPSARRRRRRRPCPPAATAPCARGRCGRWLPAAARVGLLAQDGGRRRRCDRCRRRRAPLPAAAAVSTSAAARSGPEVPAAAGRAPPPLRGSAAACRARPARRGPAPAPEPPPRRSVPPPPAAARLWGGSATWSALGAVADGPSSRLRRLVPDTAVAQAADPPWQGNHFPCARAVLLDQHHVAVEGALTPSAAWLGKTSDTEIACTSSSCCFTVLQARDAAQRVPTPPLGMARPDADSLCRAAAAPPKPASAPEASPRHGAAGGSFGMRAAECLLGQSSAPCGKGKGTGKGKGKGKGQDLRELATIDWNGTEIKEASKDVSFPHPSVQERTVEDCRRIWASQGIRCHFHGREDAVAEDEWDLPKPIVDFEEAAFPDWATDELRARGWKSPTPIQSQAWPTAVRGHDIIGVAETGSGKTMAYVLPMIMHVRVQSEIKPGEGPAGLVLVPSRELAVQVAEQYKWFERHTGIKCTNVFE